MISWWLNFVGLLLATGAACLMYFFPPATTQYLPDGSVAGPWKSSPSESGQKAFRRQSWMKRLGIVALGIGFAFQVLAAIVGRFVETTVVAPTLVTAPMNGAIPALGWTALRQLLSELSANHEFWNGFWAAVFGTAFGAFLAFALERNRRNRERIRDELGRCHTLVYMLTHMLSMLEDFQEQLFTTKAKELGRPPKWSEIGGLEGAPERVPSFALSEYVFLLDKPADDDKSPELLNDVYLTVSNMEMVLGRINLRTRLWHEYLVGRATGAFQRGDEAAVNAGQYGATAKRIEELTLWLAEDLPEAIVKFRGLFPRLYAVLKVRYPKESFLYPAPVQPKDDRPGLPGVGGRRSTDPPK